MYNYSKYNKIFLGFDDLFKEFETAATKPKFPPYNIIKRNDGDLTIEFALAGFKKDQIEIEVEDSRLTISSVEDEGESDEAEYIYKGIGKRNFKSSFKLGQYLEVESANFEDGILTIELVKNVPEEKKPKKIDIL